MPIIKSNSTEAPQAPDSCKQCTYVGKIPFSPTLLLSIRMTRRKLNSCFNYIFIKMEIIEDGGGVGRGEHFLPHKFIKRAFKRRVNSTKQLLNAGRGHQAHRKAAQLFERR